MSVKIRRKNTKNAIVLLPFMIMLILAASTILITTKMEYEKSSLNALTPRLDALDLQLLSIKEQVKLELKNGTLNGANFQSKKYELGDFTYIAVVKNFDGSPYFFVDIYGVYSDKSGEFMQKFSTKETFIFAL